MDDTAPNSDFALVQEALEGFLSSRASLVMGTRDASGSVELSMAPCLIDAGSFHVLLSDLAPHTGHLRRDLEAQVLLLEDEQDARQPFARTRVSLSCSAQWLDAPEAQGILAKMEAQFGGIVSLLRSLPDFHLIRLVPREGRYVAGFGRAYRLSGLAVVEHLRG